MNREILFRGKIITNGQWVFGSLVQCTDSKGNDFTQIENGHFNQHRVWEVDPKTVGQYTGYKDNYEEKIFEGDFVKMNLDDEIKEAVGHVWYNQDQMCFEVYDNIPDDKTRHWTYIEVLGNIHDNPELLKS